MTLDEAIKDMETIAEGNQMAIDTGIVFNDTPIDMLFCDNTEAKNKRLANYQRCAEEHRQLAKWLKELKQLREQIRWIPVRERLPETDDDVLVTDGVDMFVAWYSRKGMWQGWMSSDNNFERNTPIDAWMPLPKPYEPQESEDKE